VKNHDFVSLCRIEPGRSVRLADFDPGWNGDPGIPKAERKRAAVELLAAGVEALTRDQELLYAADSWSVLVIFQAMDSAGKDSAIKHVMSGINPQGCQVFSFKHPSAEELDHNFLWRCMKSLPERGRIGIFNRSYYEEVLIVRVHPELVTAQRVPGADPGSDEFWQRRYEDINTFERHLTRNGTAIIKFFLHVSKEEQRQRFLKRIRRPDKHWKFAAGDIDERSCWDDYMRAYEQMLSATSTAWAPWYVVPADHKWATRAIVADVLCRTIESLDLCFPEVTPEDRQLMEAARQRLEAEGQA
jgi:PPK2 family polyphosphate:nucleotide phosphotransferase